MTIYIDLTIILLILNGLLSYYVVSHILLRNIKWYQYLVIGLLLALEILIIYNGVLFLILYSVIFLLVNRMFFKDDFIKFYVLTFIFKSIFVIFLLLLIEGIKMKYLVPYIEDIKALYVLIIYPILFVITYLITLYVDNVFRLVRFKEEVVLIIKDKQYIMNGYFDSGNLLEKDKNPVVFINKKKFPLKMDVLTDAIDVSTITGEKTLLCMPSLIRMISKKEYTFCYLCVIDDETNFNGCDLLLNARLL